MSTTTATPGPAMMESFNAGVSGNIFENNKYDV